MFTLFTVWNVSVPPIHVELYIVTGALTCSATIEASVVADMSNVVRDYETIFNLKTNVYVQTI